jgi:hypothetical protein
MSERQNIQQAIHAVKTALALHGIGKDRKNNDQKYSFRGVEDVVNALSELFVQHRINVVPRIIHTQSIERQTSNGKPMPSSFVDAEFDLVSVDDGSLVTFKACGEGADMSDKGTNKAMSAAFKYAMTLGFVIPTVGVLDEGDATTPGSEREERPAQSQQQTEGEAEPDGGWGDWARGLIGKVKAATTGDQLNRLRDDEKRRINAVKKHDQAMFNAIGAAFADARKLVLDDDVPF